MHGCTNLKSEEIHCNVPSPTCHFMNWRYRSSSLLIFLHFLSILSAWYEHYIPESFSFTNWTWFFALRYFALPSACQSARYVFVACQFTSQSQFKGVNRCWLFHHFLLYCVNELSFKALSISCFVSVILLMPLTCNAVTRSLIDFFGDLWCGRVNGFWSS